MRENLIKSLQKFQIWQHKFTRSAMKKRKQNPKAQTEENQKLSGWGTATEGTALLGLCCRSIVTGRRTNVEFGLIMREGGRRKTGNNRKHGLIPSDQEHLQASWCSAFQQSKILRLPPPPFLTDFQVLCVKQKPRFLQLKFDHSICSHKELTTST